MVSQTPLIEVKAKKGDDYKTVCRKAAKPCNLKETETRELCQCLFRINEVQILHKNLTVAKKQKRWTIGNYLKAIKKVPENIKFGIRYIKRLPDEETADN